MIGPEKIKLFIDKLIRLTDDKELKWDVEIRTDVFYAAINSNVTIAIDVNCFKTDVYKIGVIISSAGSAPIWLNTEKTQLFLLIKSIDESRRMPDYIADWIEEFLTK